MHGGKSLTGIAHPKYEHGRRMSRLPPRMLEDAAAAWRDPELSSIREDIVIADARISDLVGRVDTGESGRLWRELNKTWNELRYEADEDRKASIYHRFEGLMERGVADYDAWDEVKVMQDHKAKLVQMEMKRLVQNGSMIPADQALAIFGRLYNEIKKNVTDRRALANISRAAVSLVSGPLIEVIGEVHGEEAQEGDFREVSAQAR